MRHATSTVLVTLHQCFRYAHAPQPITAPLQPHIEWLETHHYSPMSVDNTTHLLPCCVLRWNKILDFHLLEFSVIHQAFTISSIKLHECAYLERNIKLRGVISLRNDLPICAIPKGIYKMLSVCHTWYLF